jgi:predicted extracellular nuclease
LPTGGQITSGTYQPGSFGAAVTFPAPAPAKPYGTKLAAVNGKDGNVLFPGSCAGDPGYKAYVLGNDGRGRNLGLLVRSASVASGKPRVEVLSLTQAGASARFTHADGSSELLTTRPALVLEARVHDGNGRGLPVTVIANQLTALEGNLSAAGPHGWATLGDYLQAKRAAQAGYLAGLVQARQSAHPAEKLVLLGDFNASEFSDGKADLLGLVTGRPTAQGKVLHYLASPVRQPLTNLTTGLPNAERYTVIRDGNAQAVDHILVNAALLKGSPTAHVEVARINADFAEDNLGDAGVPMRVSDHDPVVGYFELR